MNNYPAGPRGYEVHAAHPAQRLTSISARMPRLTAEEKAASFRDAYLGGGLPKGDLHVVAARMHSGRSAQPNFIGIQDIRYMLTPAQVEALQQGDLDRLKNLIVDYMCEAIGKAVDAEVERVLNGSAPQEKPRSVLSNYEPEPDA